MCNLFKYATQINPVTEEGLRFKSNLPGVVQKAGSVPGLSYFDAQFFKVHYRLGNTMDPMGRKILEQSYQAIYDAGEFTYAHTLLGPQEPFKRDTVVLAPRAIAGAGGVLVSRSLTLSSAQVFYCGN